MVVPIPTEDVECQVFHNWLCVNNIPHTHIPNESRSSKKDAAIRGRKLKSLGVSRGYWDYDVYIPVIDVDDEDGAYELVKIEMKRAKKSLSKVSEAQELWGAIYEKAGIEHHICYGADEAIEKVKETFERINGKRLVRKKLDF